MKQAPPGPSQRQLRIAEQIRHLLAETIARGELRDPDLFGVPITITEVRIGPDLKHATAFITRLGRSDAEALLPALRRAAPFLRGEVARGLRLKFAPALSFRADTALDHAMYINKLMHAPEVARDLAPPASDAKD